MQHKHNYSIAAFEKKTAYLIFGTYKPPLFHMCILFNIQMFSLYFT